MAMQERGKEKEDEGRMKEPHKTTSARMKEEGRGERTEKSPDPRNGRSIHFRVIWTFSISPHSVHFPNFRRTTERPNLLHTKYLVGCFINEAENICNLNRARYDRWFWGSLRLRRRCVNDFLSSTHHTCPSCFYYFPCWCVVAWPLPTSPTTHLGGSWTL